VIDPIQTSFRVASSGLYAQSMRMRVVSENIANAYTSAADAASDPYRRKTVTFGDELSRSEGVRYVGVRQIGVDMSPFRLTHDPGNPAANGKGEVKMPNVDPVLELADLREANHGYQANLQVIRQARDLFSLTLDLLKA